MPCLTRFGLNEDEEFIINNLKTMVHVMYNCDYLKAVKTTRFYARVILRIVKQGKSIVGYQEVARIARKSRGPRKQRLYQIFIWLVKKHLDKQCKNHSMSMACWCSKTRKSTISLGCMNPHAFVATMSICLKCKAWKRRFGRMPCWTGLQQPCHRHWCHFRRGRGSAGEIYE